MRYLTLFGLALLFLSSGATASPWGREEGELFVAPQVYYYTADRYWDRHGNERSLKDTFKKWEFATYAEYGIDGKHTLTLRVPYQHLESGDSSTSGLADVEVGLIRKLKEEGRSVFSGYLLAVVPTGYSINDDLRLGYGRLGLEGGLLAGYGGDRYFLEGGAGYRYYFGYPSDQIRGYGRFGLKGDRWILMDTLEVHYGLNNGDRKRVGRNVTLEPYYRLVQNDLSFVYRLTDHLAVSFGFVKALWGRNTGNGKSFYGQVWFPF